MYVPILYIYIYVHVHIDIQICTDVHVHSCMCIYIYIYMHVYIYIYIHTYVRTYVHTYVRTYIHTYIHVYVYAYACTYTCMCHVHKYISIVCMHTTHVLSTISHTIGVYIIMCMYVCIYIYDMSLNLKWPWGKPTWGPVLFSMMTRFGSDSFGKGRKSRMADMARWQKSRAGLSAGLSAQGVPMDP